MNVLRAPFLFLAIRFRGKASYIFVMPLILTLLSISVLFYFRSSIQVLGQSGLFSKLLAIMPIAGGFFVAALTVILSQSHSILQSNFSGSDKPSLKSDEEPMTRQRFLALLFGYLSFSSFSITGIVAGIDLIAPAFRLQFNQNSWDTVKFSTVFFVLFWTFQMFSCSLIGLYYLTDRLYRSNATATFRKELPKD